MPNQNPQAASDGRPNESESSENWQVESSVRVADTTSAGTEIMESGDSLAPLPQATLPTGLSELVAGPFQAAPIQVPPIQVAPVQVTEYPVTFTGTAGEYFRVWIVNVALTFVTLGIYLPWARVRTRQYFYGHTWVDGHNFEYRANPLALLKGYLLVGGLFLGYSVSMQFEKTLWIGIVLLLIYIAVYPWLVRQSMRFQAVNTVHRGLNFRFLGTVGDSYVAYGLANIVAGLTSIFGLPWAWFMQRRFQVQNLTYGGAKGNFRGEVAEFYLIALKAFGLSVAGAILVGIPAIMAVALLVGEDANIFESSAFSTGMIVGVVGLYLAFILLYTLAWQYARGAIMAYVLNNGELGGVVRSRATFSPWQLVWITLTNTLAQVFTLGLASPWAAIRRSKYVLEGIQVRAIASLDDFAAGAVQQESALGEAATELLDIQVGF